MAARSRRAVLLAPDETFDRSRSERRNIAVEQRAGERKRRRVRCRRGPSGRRGIHNRQADAGRVIELQVRQAARVHRVLEKIRFLGRGQVAQVGLQRRHVCLAFRVLELRDCDGGKNPDNHHNDQQLNEGESRRHASAPIRPFRSRWTTRN